MKKTYALLGGLTLFISAAATGAEHNELSAEVIQEIKSADITKFCTYKNELYGKGAILEVGTTMMTCWADRFTGNLEWQEGTKSPR